MLIIIKISLFVEKKITNFFSQFYLKNKTNIQCYIFPTKIHKKKQKYMFINYLH